MSEDLLRDFGLSAEDVPKVRLQCTCCFNQSYADTSQYVVLSHCALHRQLPRLRPC